MLKLCIFAVVIHLLFLYSVFDLYFTSPLVPVTRRYAIPGNAAAKRLVLFVCDGLRVDKFFTNNVQTAPFLKNIMENGAVFGISNTKVPTESRPGHVAMIAGFYEDVAAITKGWKENPVEFDSVFNQSRHTWAWGSPDILPMFERGAVHGRVSSNMYDSSFEDFAKNASILDTWVFEHVEQFFRDHSLTKEARSSLDDNGLVFFLHLLGTDTIGHADKPHSPKYSANVELVDRGVERIWHMVNEYFGNDNATAFIFSSDHGMRDWGSHGAGHPDETMTPFVAWGAGFSGTSSKKQFGLLSDLTDFTKLPQISQADIAPLMACVIGANYPANSVGKVPVDFLSVDDKYKAECLLVNAQQLAETALNLHNAYKVGSLLSFSPYPDFDIDLIEQNLVAMKELTLKGQLKAVQQQASIFIDHMLAASRYYHTYNNTYIGFAVSSGFLLWIAYVICQIMSANYDEYNSSRTTAVLRSGGSFYSAYNLTLLVISSLVFMVLLLKRSPLSHYAYWLLPVYLGCQVFFRQFEAGSIWAAASTDNNNFRHSASSLRNWICFIAIVGGLEAVVWAYWYRAALTIAIVGAALFVAVFGSSRQSFFLFPSAICCMIVFPLLPPADSGQQLFSLVFAVAIFVLLISCLTSFDVVTRFDLLGINLKPHCHSRCRKARVIQCVLLAVSLIVKAVTVNSIAASTSVPLYCHLISWLLLVVVWFPPLSTCATVSAGGNLQRSSNSDVVFNRDRVFSTFTSIFIIYSLLSVFYESLYLVVLQFVLFVWISTAAAADSTIAADSQINTRSRSKSAVVAAAGFGSIVADAFLLVIFVNVSLLAPANIAVINSFDLVSVYSFLTLFYPFVMMTLLIIKVVLPVLCVVVAFVEICCLRGYSLTTSLLLVMALSDFTALHFFFSVRTEGSWLEIGTSLSHYCIQMFAAVALIPFVALSRFFLFSQLADTFIVAPRRLVLKLFHNPQPKKA